MRVVAVVNQKGGVAKTTTVANLGACLAERGLRTLLIDMDPQANLSLGLGVRQQPGETGMHNALLEPDSVPLSGLLRQVGELPLFLVPSSIDLAHAESILTPLLGSAYRMRNALEELTRRETFDWVLFDCPPSLGRLTEIAVVASQFLLIPTEPRLYSFAGMDTLNKMVVGLSKDLRFQIQLLGVLITMYERGTRLHRTIAQEIRERFGDRVFQTEICKNMRVSEAEIAGKPVALFDHSARGARAYAALTGEVIARSETLLRRPELVSAS